MEATNTLQFAMKIGTTVVAAAAAAFKGVLLRNTWQQFLTAPTLMFCDYLFFNFF